MDLQLIEEIKDSGMPFFEAKSFLLAGFDLGKTDLNEMFNELIWDPNYGFSAEQKTYRTNYELLKTEVIDSHGPYTLQSMTPSHFSEITFDALLAEVDRLSADGSTIGIDRKKRLASLKKIDGRNSRCFKLQEAGLKKVQFTPYHEWHEFIVVEPKVGRLWTIVVGAD